MLQNWLPFVFEDMLSRYVTEQQSYSPHKLSVSQGQHCQELALCLLDQSTLQQQKSQQPKVLPSVK